jgi:hypothetical protein
MGGWMDGDSQTDIGRYWPRDSLAYLESGKGNRKKSNTEIDRNLMIRKKELKKQRKKESKARANK